MRRTLLVTVLALLPIAPAALADTTFNLLSHQADGSLIEGFVDINTVLGKVDFADLTYSADGSFKGPIQTFMTPVQESNDDGYTLTLFPAFKGSVFTGYYYDLRLPVTTLVGYDGGPICSLDAGGCGGAVSTTLLNGGSAGDALDGTLALNEPSTVTPEPSSFGLLCTGLMGMAGLVRKGRLAGGLSRG